MKEEILTKLSEFSKRLRSLKKELSSLPTKRVSRKPLQTQADDIADMWVEELRSPLEHKFKINKKVVEETAELMKRLHVLANPNNLKSSYIEVINKTLKNFNNKFILPIKQMTIKEESILDLYKLIPSLPDEAESDYLKEAFDCANSGYRRAAIVMGWCAAIDRIQKKISKLGLKKFNDTSKELKEKDKGRFKKFNRVYYISTLAELQDVPDSDLITILEGMELLDGNQADRLRTCFQYRIHSAHPGEAPIEDPNVASFFSDINKIVLQNPEFEL